MEQTSLKVMKKPLEAWAIKNTSDDFDLTFSSFQNQWIDNIKATKEANKHV